MGKNSQDGTSLKDTETNNLSSWIFQVTLERLQKKGKDGIVFFYLGRQGPREICI